jgi:3-oxoacyl-[acyl-carrier protein] reductase
MSRVALVTGGSRGIGKAIAERLVRDGYRVAISYNNTQPDVPGAEALQADLAFPEQCERLVRNVERKLGPVEILVNNAGALSRGDIFDMNQAEFEAMRKVNVDGLVAVTRAALPGMKEKGWGRIVNLTSIAAHGTAFAGTTFYAMTKAAVSLLTRRLAYEFGPHGVTVNAIAPGFIWTDMVTQGKREEELTEIEQRMSDRAMVRRVGTVEDIAHATAFLVSDGAGFLTAQVLTVDGGRMDYIGHP